MNAQRERSTRLLRIVVGVLAVLGIATAMARAVNTVITVGAANAGRAHVTAYDSLGAAVTMDLMRAQPGTPEHALTETRVAALERKYREHPAYTLIHVVTAIVLMLLVPLQFSGAFRRRHLRVHRWTGRAVLVMLLSISVSAFYLGAMDDTVPPLERPTIALIVSFFVAAGVRAFVAIRRRDVARHREWMIRMFSMALAITTVRLVALPLAYLIRRYDTALVTSFWVGMLLNLAIAEWWIRYTRRPAEQPMDVRMPLTSLAEVVGA